MTKINEILPSMQNVKNSTVALLSFTYYSADKPLQTV